MIILAIQSTYVGIEIALYNTDFMHFLGHALVPKNETSTVLSTIDTLLINHKLTINKIGYCLVNRGPAPFTTLRTVIATANGLKAALQIPLIGMSGLDLLSSEYDMTKRKAIILLNAFANDFYFYIDNNLKGIGSMEEIKSILKSNDITSIIGNGGPLIKNNLPHEFSWKFVDSEKGTCSLHTLITEGYQQATNPLYSPKINPYITPLYFKEMIIF
jgi:tRNA A37 threonylcarbamoyladenosine modification protein TsaB